MKAIAWGEYLESHAQRVYHVAANPDIAAATALARKIMKGELTDGFTLREVHRHEWSGLTDRDADLLCELDWLRWTKEETGGAPKVRYWINPKIVDLPPATRQNRQSPRERPSVSFVGLLWQMQKKPEGRLNTRGRVA
jgi:putative DNA primase/helicase